jgi:N-acetylglucosaminyldiphosphoundecaprenol N-acetyl-beta-D-mannosaminyltransferase
VTATSHAASVEEERRPPQTPAPRALVLGVPISVVTMSSAVSALGEQIRQKEAGYICFADVNSVMVAQSAQGHMRNLRGASMIMPDGMPLTWAVRARGESRITRVAGPDFLEAVIRAAEGRQWKHFLLGGTDAVVQTLQRRLEAMRPGVSIVGVLSPPFRALTPDEETAIVDAILQSGADIVWVGLGCPKQERWMAEHKHLLPGIVQIGVGAAFDFHAGSVRRAPVLMRDLGLEWLHRLMQDPKRLWRRYLIHAPTFILANLLEVLKGPERGRSVSNSGTPP